MMVVINKNEKAVYVDVCEAERCFRILNLETLETKTLSIGSFVSNDFKYENEIIAKFRKVFGGSGTVLISETANKTVHELIEANRIMN